MLYVNKVKINTGQQMILYKCKECKIKYKEFILDKVIIHKWCSFLYSDDESVNCLSKSNVSNSFFQKIEGIL